MTTFVQSPLLFLRHGETDWNARKLYQGRQDIPLNERGRQQARQNAVLVGQLIDSGVIDREKIKVFSSPLSRAAETARIIASEMQLPAPFTELETLREISMGDWEGLTSPQVKERFYDQRKARKADRWAFLPPNGESMASRAPGITDAVAQLPANSIIITHTVVLRILLHSLGECDKNASAAKIMAHGGAWLFDGQKMHHHTL